MSQEIANFQEEGIDDPPARASVSQSAAGAARVVVYYQAFRRRRIRRICRRDGLPARSDDDGIVPKAGLRRFEFHVNVSQFGIYVHQFGRLFAADFVAIAVTSTAETFHDADPLAELVPTFTRLSGAVGIGPTINESAVEAIARLPQDEIENGAPSATLDPKHQQPSWCPK